MSVVLLVSAVTLLVGLASPAPHSPHENLIRMTDFIDKYNRTLTTEWYVESVRHLSEGTGRCGDTFFCKVHDILIKHKNTTGGTQDEGLVRNLNQFIRNVKCTEALMKVESTTEKIQIPTFLDYLKKCIQCRNTRREETSC